MIPKKRRGHKSRRPQQGLTDRCILSVIFPCVNIRTWTDEIDFPKPGKKHAASGRLNSSNTGGNSVKLPKSLVCPQRRSASGWRICVSTAWRHGGPSRGPQGPSRLAEAQLRLIPELLSHGAGAYGFRGEVWTCARVATVIWEEFGVSYHKAHVSRLLKRLHWTPQLPIERAAQRDEEIIKQWRIEVWPELKKRHA
jgi:transposase